MKFIAAVSFLAAAVAGQRAVVHNNCDATVFIQSWPFDGSATGPLTTVRKGEAFSEDLRPSGSTIKISKAKNLDQPLFLGYSFSKNPDYAYYELNTRWGNPFADKRVTLSPGEGCQDFNCAPNDAGCYSTPAMSKVYGCPEPVELTATLCA